MVGWAVRNGRSGRLLGVAALVFATGALPARGAKPPLCPGGVFEVEAAAGPLVPAGAVPDLLHVGDDGAVSIASGCPEIAGKLRAARRGTKLSARWTAKKGLCIGLSKKASLRARFDAACETVTGKFETKGRRLAFTATRAGIVLDGHVPSSIRGERLQVGRASGAEMLAADAGWAGVFAALGASADAVEVATSAPLPGSALDLHASAWTAPGAGWSQRIAELAAGIAAHPASGYAAEESALGGRTTLKVTVPGDPGYAASYYVVDGDTLVLLTSRDEPLVADLLAELPAPAAALAAGSPRGADPPLPGGFLLAVLPLRPVARPVCVAEPFGRVTLDLTAIDGYYRLPVPAFFGLLSGPSTGEVTPPQLYGPAVMFRYRAIAYRLAPEQVTVQAVAPAGGTGSALVSFPVQHCLNGTWQDGDRVVEVTQALDHLIARVVSGTICGQAGGIDFTGDMTTPESFEGSDLKVCNPEECVEAGLLEPSVLVDYTADIAPDGNSAELSWGSTQFDFVYDDDGELVGCPPNGDVQPRTFTIQRLTFGPGPP